MITKIAIRLRLHPAKRRSAVQRLKARIYRRRNRTRIKMQRKRYLRMHKTQLKLRKTFQRFKPAWYKKPKKPKKFKLFVPHKTTKHKPRSFKPHKYKPYKPPHRPVHKRPKSLGFH